MFKEFKEFAMRGNVVDLAVGVIIGAAFGKIVSSLVEDVIMPPIGQLIGKVEFSSLFISLDGKSYASMADAKLAHVATLNYGLFLNTVINFLIVAFVVFLVVQWMNRPNEKTCIARSTDNERLPAMCDDDSYRREALRTLHGAARLDALQNSG